MAFNIEVISTAALAVRLGLKHLNYAEAEITENDPNHVYDQVVIEKIHLSIYDKLSTSTVPVYHRLKYTLRNPAEAAEYVHPRPAVDGAYFIDLIPLNTHTTAGIDTNVGFATSENSYDVVGGDTLVHKVIGRVSKRFLAQDIRYVFELQYQVDPMTGVNGAPIGRNPAAAAWTTYTRALDTDVMIVPADGPDAGDNDIQARVKIIYTSYSTEVDADNITPPPNIARATKLYRRKTVQLPNDVNLPDTLVIGGTTYTTEAGPDAGYPQNVWDALFTGTLGSEVPVAEIDYVIVAYDESPNLLDASPIDDYTNVTVLGKGAIQIQQFIVRSSIDTTPINNGPYDTTDVDMKIFRGKTTKIFTTLYWPNVFINDISLSMNDPESNNFVPYGASGFTDTDNGETRIGVSTEANGRVYLIVTLSLHSTSLLLDQLVVAQGTPVYNPFTGTGVGTTFYDAPPNSEFT